MAISHKLRLKIYSRDKFICGYCKKKFKFIELQIDHIHPRSKGGQDIPINFITACVKCNLSKSDKILKNPPIVTNIIIEPGDFIDAFWEGNKYNKVVKVTKKDHKWLMEEYRKQQFKSLAAFLEVILEDNRTPNLFKRKK